MDKPVFILVRQEEKDGATWGTLIGGSFAFRSMELPWGNNSIGISCIPPGAYDVTPDKSGKHKYFTLDVKGRTSIEIHPANSPRELRGCIALGLSVKMDNGGIRFLYASKSAMDEMWSAFPVGFTLIITSGENILKSIGVNHA